jgi:hypothetical protein
MMPFQVATEPGAAMTNFKADTLSDFIEAAAKKYGDGSLGKTDPVTTMEGFLLKGGKLTKISFTFKATVDSAAFGGGEHKGKPDKANGDAIAKVVHMALEHERKHKAGYEAAFEKWNAQAVKDLKAGTYKDKKEAEDAIAQKMHELNDKLRDACLDLHSTEGLIQVNRKGGSIDVAMTAAGKTGCD